MMMDMVDFLRNMGSLRLMLECWLMLNVGLMVGFWGSVNISMVRRIVLHLVGVITAVDVKHLLCCLVGMLSVQMRFLLVLMPVPALCDGFPLKKV